MRPSSVIVYASQVAAAIGCNRHKKPSDALELMWERVDPESYHAALARNGVESEAACIDRIASDNDDARGILQRSMVQCASSTDVAARYDLASRSVSTLASLEDDDRRIVDAAIKRNLYTNYGTASEHHALVKVRETLGIDARPDPTFYKQRVGEVGGTPIWIGGKIDAITDDRIVIEIKNRIRRLFYKVPFYEVVQVQCYLALLDVPRGAVVECLTTAPGTSTINIVPVRRDRMLWNETIVPKVKAFVAVFLDLMEDVAFQDAYLSSPRRAAVVQARMGLALRQHITPQSTRAGGP